MRIVSLASGSKGNCVAVECGAGVLLIDCGIGIKQIIERAKVADIKLDNVKGVLVTHEHFDHVRALDKLNKYIPSPVYMHPRSRKMIQADNFNYIGDNDNYELGFDIGEFKVRPFRSPHDSEYCVGYRIESEGKSVTLATDLGFVTTGAMSMLRESDAVILESNHDMAMLKACAYPYVLKQRIMSNTGHLSNVTASDTVRQLASFGTRKFMLAHLSENSNTPTKAYDATAAVLKESGADIGGDVELYIAKQHGITCFNV